MFEAVKRFFPTVVEGKIANLEATARSKLAEQCILIGVKRADRANSRYPTYTVVDFGEGQEPEDFPSTFLSLSERNKEGIPFVQGKYNMGSTGSAILYPIGYQARTLQAHRFTAPWNGLLSGAKSYPVMFMTCPH